MAKPLVSEILEKLKTIVAQKRADWTDADLQLAARVGQDLLELTAKKALGEDVDKEIDEAGTSVANIAAGAKVSGAAAIREALEAVLAGVLNRVLRF